MKYSELISELEYWKELSEEDDPEIVVNDTPYSYEIVGIRPVKGINKDKAIGILFE